MINYRWKNTLISILKEFEIKQDMNEIINEKHV